MKKNQVARRKRKGESLPTFQQECERILALQDAGMLDGVRVRIASKDGRSVELDLAELM